MSNDIEYEIVQDDMLVASACGDNALNEIKHYAAQYEQDGPIKVYELTRREIDLAAPSVASGAQELIDDALSKVSEIGTVGAMKWLAAAIAAQAKPVDRIAAINLLQVREDGSMRLETTFGGYVEFDGVNEWTFPASAKGLQDFIKELMLQTKQACSPPSCSILANSAPNKALVEALQLASAHLDWSLPGEEYRVISKKINDALRDAGAVP